MGRGSLNTQLLKILRGILHVGRNSHIWTVLWNFLRSPAILLLAYVMVFSRANCPLSGLREPPSTLAWVVLIFPFLRSCTNIANCKGLMWHGVPVLRRVIFYTGRWLRDVFLEGRHWLLEGR